MPGHGIDANLRGVGQFSPGTASGWPTGLADSLRTAAQVRLMFILSADEALCNLGPFAFVTSHLLSKGRVAFSISRGALLYNLDTGGDSH